MKKGRMGLIVSAFLIMIFITGCGNKTQNNDSQTTRALTKAEWIFQLGEAFGYNTPMTETAFFSDVPIESESYDQIQACAEWGVITENETFHPNDSATLQYAVETTVRAIGIEKINAAISTTEPINEEDLITYFTSNIANLNMDEIHSAVTQQEADQILQLAYEHATNLQYKEVFDYTLNEHVYEIAPTDIILRGDGQSAWVTNGSAYQTGDILYVLPTDTAEAYAIKIVMADGADLVYQAAGVDEVFENLHISGSYTGNVLSASCMDEDVEYVVYESEKSNIRSCSDITPIRVGNVMPLYANKGGIVTDVSTDGNAIKYKKDLKNGGVLTVDISNIVANIDFEVGLGKPQQVDATVRFDDKACVKYVGNPEPTASTINLGKVKVQLGYLPCSIEFQVNCSVGVSGEAELTYTSTVVGNVACSKRGGFKGNVTTKNNALDFHAQVTATIEPTMVVMLKTLGTEVADVWATTGIVGVATVDADILGTQPSCIDVLAYVPLRWGINQNNCLVTYINNKWKITKTIWDSTNSKFKWHAHYENLIPVDACTRDTEQKVITPDTDSEGNAYEEYTLFDFEEIDDNVIELAGYSMYLLPGESLRIGIESLPDGYSASDLVYSIENPSICSVSDGTVYAGESGATTVEVSTPDGKYKTYILVVIEATYIEFNEFLAL